MKTYRIHARLMNFGSGEREVNQIFRSSSETLEGVKQDFYNTFLTIDIYSICEI